LSGEVKYLLALLILFNIVDGALTNFLVELGLVREGNPFLLSVVGQPEFIILKVTGAALATLVLWDINRRHPRLALVSAQALCFATESLPSGIFTFYRSKWTKKKYRRK